MNITTMSTGNHLRGKHRNKPELSNKRHSCQVVQMRKRPTQSEKKIATISCSYQPSGNAQSKRVPNLHRNTSETNDLGLKHSSIAEIFISMKIEISGDSAKSDYIAGHHQSACRPFDLLKYVNKMIKPNGTDYHTNTRRYFDRKGFSTTVITYGCRVSQNNWQAECGNNYPSCEEISQFHYGRTDSDLVLIAFGYHKRQWGQSVKE